MKIFMWFIFGWCVLRFFLLLFASTADRLKWEDRVARVLWGMIVGGVAIWDLLLLLQ